MPATMTREAADTIVRAALHGFASDEFLAGLSATESLRPALDLDSIDFLTFVERLSKARDLRIEEDDYPHLTTIASCVDFLVR